MKTVRRFDKSQFVSLPSMSYFLGPIFNPRRAGGVFEHPPPLRFFADISKTAARSAAVFGTPVRASFPHML